MSTITLKRALPGLPAGSVLTLDAAAGVYRDAAKTVWLDARAAIDDDIVEKPGLEGESYWFINDSLQAEGATWSSRAADRRRKAANNFFRKQERAERLAERIRSFVEER